MPRTPAASAEPAILAVHVVPAASAVLNTLEDSVAPAAPAISTALVPPVASAGYHIENLFHPLCARDRVIINFMAHFIRDIHDPFASALAHALI